MRLICALLASILLQVAVAQEKSWGWGQEHNDSPAKLTGEVPQQIPDNIAASAAYNEEVVQLNSTEIEKVVDDILTSTRQGRALDGYDEVYSDPNVQEALQSGDDGQARNLIKDRLCFLGLMQCDEHIEGKRPYIAPEELVYAQPVAINPVGKPIPTIPIKGVKSGPGYGPPRPLPPYGNRPPGKFGPPPSKFGPPPPYSANKPPRRGYGPPPNKQFIRPPFEKPFLNGEIYEGSDYLSQSQNGFIGKPQGVLTTDHDIPYEFEHGQHISAHEKDKKVEVVVTAHGGSVSGGSSANGGVLEHVHHHYHHSADTKTPTVVVNPIPVAAVAGATVSGSQSSLSSSFGQAENSFFKPSSSYNTASNGFGGLNVGGGGLTIGGGGLGGSYGGQTIANYGSSSFGVKPVHENFGPQTFNSFGASVGSYGSTSGLYKKELNLNSGSSNYLQSSYADKYQGVESSRRENFDCVCVPYDQCPSHDIIGRKDDLYLPLDPRNLKSDIEAEEEERVITDGNGTMTVVRVPKEASLNVTKLEAVNKTEEAKKVSKREAPVESTSEKSNIEARQYGGSYNNKKVKPTFGVSFGLPQQGGGGYPINPYGPNPHVNPYGGAIGQSGINLGLVSVNPLVSIQVTKDDYGEKVVKPFINLHVTPNNYLVHKLEDVLSYKKHIVFNKHKHLHYHKPSYYQHGPHYYPHNHPEIYKEHPYPSDIYHGPPGPSYHPAEYESHGPPGPSFHPGHYESHGPPGPIDYEGPPHFSHGPPSHYSSEPGYHDHKPYEHSYYDDPLNYGGIGGAYEGSFFGRTLNNTDFVNGNSVQQQYEQQYNDALNINNNYNTRAGKSLSLTSSSNSFKFPSDRKRRDLTQEQKSTTKRQAYYGNSVGGRPSTCGPRHVCCKRPLRPNVPTVNRQCGTRHSQGINGRIKNPVYVDGDSEFGEYPWQVAILKKDPKESVYVCGGTLIDPLHLITAAHCVKTYTNFDLRVRLGEWDVNHDVEFYPYIERDIVSVNVHPEFYAGTLYNDLAILRMDKPVDFSKQPHISPACLPHPQDDYTGSRCWTTGWGKDAFGDFGKYQNILKEVDVPIVGFQQCQRQLQQTRLGYDFQLHPGFVCAGGEEGKDACKGDGGGPMVCERGGTWQVVGVVSWGIGCGQAGVPGVYVKVAHYLDWIRQVTQLY